jgi:hypothetical protein
MSAPTLADYAIVYIGLGAVLAMLCTILWLAIRSVWKARKCPKEAPTDKGDDLLLAAYMSGIYDGRKYAKGEKGK